MPIKIDSRLLMFVALLSCTLPAATMHYNPSTPPPLIVNIIIDQFPYYYLLRHGKHLRHGIKKFMKQGTFYDNAYHPHGIPETAPGHTSICSGVYPRDHGITANSWFDDEGNPVYFGDDTAEGAELLTSTKTAIGKSAGQIKVDNLSDQISMHQVNTENYKAFSIAIKERSAIATAGHLGKAFWFDDQGGVISSSKAYMPQLPRWVERFNDRHAPTSLKTVAWHELYPHNKAAYDYPYIDDTSVFELPFRLVNNTKIPVHLSKEEYSKLHLKSPYDVYLKTPIAAGLVIDFALDCIRHNFRRTNKEKMMLWVCLSPLDLAGHFYGPDSREIIDFIYQTDKQIGDFMTHVERMVGRHKVLFTLTADHGIQPTQEISRKRGLDAHRIMAKDLIKQMNKAILEEFGIADFVQHFESTYFTFNPTAKKEAKKQSNYDQIVSHLKTILEETPGIKKVWTFNELKNLSCQPNSHEQYFKNQLFASRFGELTCYTHPYSLITKYPRGCSHNTPYDYDTHVPLGFLHYGSMPRKRIKERVYVPQLAPTLADIIGVERPSACVLPPLPGLLQGN